MKRFYKIAALFAGIVLLLGVGLFAIKGIRNNAAAQGGAQAALPDAQAENVSRAVSAPADDEIVTIDEDSVITEEYKPAERETIPIGSGAQSTAAQTGAAAAADVLYQAGTAFLQDEQNANAVRETLSALQTNAVTIGNAVKSPGSETLSKAFFDFFGGSDDPVYSDCGVTFLSAEGVVYTASSYSRMENVLAEHSVAMELSADVTVKTECTSVTTYGELEDVTVSSFVITRQDAKGATTETYSTTKTEPK
ncbi:MAG TPA: hypothetical protein VN366_11510 [Feifaniaceae bacterium]|nr:hypothetical protein [Feifaniaceae bacterium]